MRAVTAGNLVVTQHRRVLRRRRPGTGLPLRDAARLRPPLSAGIEQLALVLSSGLRFCLISPPSFDSGPSSVTSTVFDGCPRDLSSDIFRASKSSQRQSRRIHWFDTHRQPRELHNDSEIDLRGSAECCVELRLLCPDGYVVAPNHAGYGYLVDRLASWLCRGVDRRQSRHRR
jgi:hypothetical protein